MRTAKAKISLCIHPVRQGPLVLANIISVSNDPVSGQWRPWSDSADGSLMSACAAFTLFGCLILSGVDTHLILVLLNPDIPCLCKQCRARSVGFWRSQLIWICTVCHCKLCISSLDQVIWLAENYRWAWHLNLFSLNGLREVTFQNYIFPPFWKGVYLEKKKNLLPSGANSLLSELTPF